MATLYFVCGRPTKLDVLSELFGDFEELPLDRSDVFGYGNCTDRILGCVQIESHWVISGDSDEVFRRGATIAALLSRDGRAGEFYGQTTAGYYEIVKYRKGVEIERILHRYCEPGDRVNFTLRKLSIDHLWSAADKFLPCSHAEVFNRSPRWIRPQI